MRVALIPPRGHESTVLLSDIHLVLPLVECRKNPFYRKAYEQARRRGHYIILDNGCAEGRLVDGKVLAEFAAELRANEIVAPDVMAEAEETFTATNAWLNEFPEIADAYNIMGVLQGKKDAEWQKLLDLFSDMKIDTIGVPKVHVTGWGVQKRLEIVKYITEQYPNRFKIHLLGLNGAWPLEIRDLEWPKEVRSMDSAQPYKVAEMGQMLNSEHSWAKRREDYFERYSNATSSLVETNVRTFLRWGRGESRGIRR